jgi:2'-hydroxyisoflavone reductase
MSPRILILGGTHFIGRHVVAALLSSATGQVTLFNRGRTNPGLFADARHIVGDRGGEGIAQLAAETWDVVIDLSCYYPAHLEAVLDVIDPEVRYVFVSTCSVYDNDDCQDVMRGEDAPTLSCSAAQRASDSPATYGHRKAECERIVSDRMSCSVILRPALVYGPFDTTDRFYYWLHQVRTNDTITLPDGGARRFSVSYVQDVVSAVTAAIERPECIGPYNLTSTPQISIGRIVDLACGILDRSPQRMNVSRDVLAACLVNPWVDMPLWLDADYFTYDNRRLLTAFDLEVMDVAESVARTTTYFDRAGWPQPNYGLTESQRQVLLEAAQSAS